MIVEREEGGRIERGGGGRYGGGDLIRGKGEGGGLFAVLNATYSRVLSKHPKAVGARAGRRDQGDQGDQRHG